MSRKLAAVGFALVVLCACGTDSSGTGNTPSADLASVTGSVKLVGGPHGNPPRPHTGVITAKRADDGGIVRAPVREGAYTLHLAPGIYTLTVDQAVCPQTQVTVGDGDATQDVICPIK